MKYKSEKDMYPDVCQWLEAFLNDRFRQAEVDVYSLPHTPISRFLSTYDRGSFPGEWVTWNIKVDVVGFVHHPNRSTDLVFVECKKNRLTLADLSQLLGYSRIARPLYSFLISPLGFSAVPCFLAPRVSSARCVSVSFRSWKIASRQVIVVRSGR